MKTRILLNWVPPSMIEIPSPPMSVLKAFMVSEGYQVDILYWNILFSDLQSKFVWGLNNIDKNRYALNLFFNYLAHENKDEIAFNNIKASLITLKPQYLNMHPDFFKEHMNEYYLKTKNLIDKTINSINYEDLLYIGLSVNLYQWVFSSIIAKKNKRTQSWHSNSYRWNRN